MTNTPQAHWSEEPLDQRNVVELVRTVIDAEAVEGALDGSRVIDATAGNGHDTVFLAEAVGPRGQVLAVDLQPAAVIATQARLAEVTPPPVHVRVVQGDHAGLQELAPPDWIGSVALVVFNLGYLPGAVRDLTTVASTSVHAAQAALRLLRPGGLLCMSIYTGHATGPEEAAALRSWARSLHPEAAQVRLIRDTGATSAGRPEVLLIRRTSDRPPSS